MSDRFKILNEDSIFSVVYHMGILHGVDTTLDDMKRDLHHNLLGKSVLTDAQREAIIGSLGIAASSIERAHAVLSDVVEEYRTALGVAAREAWTAANGPG